MRFRMIIAVCAVVLSIAGAEGAVPTSLTVQGKLTDASGVPLPAGAKTFTFRIFDAATLGAQIWPGGGGEIQSITSSTDGLWVGLVGAVSPLNDIVLADSVRWLEINVEGTTLPRVRLETEPYAFRVATVDGATGGSISGNLNLDLSTAMTGNILKGGTPFLHDFGFENTFVGLDAGNLTMLGGANTACGAYALDSNTNGNWNSATGAYALYRNTTGAENTACGYGALYSNRTGSGNTALGIGALYKSTTASENTATGRGALNENTTGSYNAASGSQALHSNTGGSFNTASGFGALAGNTTGIKNTATGYEALFENNEGINNTAMGNLALSSNLNGRDNTASGLEALYKNNGNYNTASGSGSLYNNTTGSYSTGNGHGALYSNTTGESNTASGFQALYYNSTGDSNDASGYLALYENTTGSNNNACGSAALERNTTGSFNAAIGRMALHTNMFGSRNTAIGDSADVATGALINATAIGARAVVNASNKIRLGDANVTVIEGQVAYTFTSDENAKENFQPVDGDAVLRKLRGMNLTSWNYKGNDPQQFRHYGPVAQEFFAAFGHDGVGTSGSPTTINSGDQAGILMIAVQALEKRNQELEQTVADLKSRLDRIEAK